jgi:hypothetical protein
MFIAALFTIAKIWNKPRCPSTNEWINEMWRTHTHTHTPHTGVLLSHKEDCVMSLTGKWMELEIIMLSEISQTEKDKCHMFCLI